MIKKPNCKDPDCPYCNPDRYDYQEMFEKSILGDGFEKYQDCYVEYKVELIWCETCMKFYVQCPTCGNNCCNGGYGTDPEDSMKPCPDCPASYDLQKNLYNSGSMDMVEKLTGKENVREEYMAKRKIEVAEANAIYEEEQRCKKDNGKSDPSN